MNGWLDALLVGSASCAAFGYAIYALGPKSWRARILAALAAQLRRLPAPGLRAAAARLTAAAGRKGGACGGCDSCGTDTGAGAGAAGAGGTGDGAADIKIPLSQIGRRR